MTIDIKICGLSTPETLTAAVEAGATHVGLVHFEPSPRHVALEQAARLRALVPAEVKTVLLLVNAPVDTTSRAIDAIKPDIIQFHGTETPEWIALVREKAQVEAWKAWGVESAEVLEKARKYEGCVDRMLYDAPARELPGGNGIAFRWDLLSGFDHHTSWGLAGGLTADNVAEAIAQTGAPLVDASSGLESAPGIKDVDRIRAFCKAAREAGNNA
jgi:phosphoribosylanthranilate isomerase